MRFISLFAGIGGFDLGLERAGMECVAQVEIDEFCGKILKKHWPDVPLYKDVRDVGKHNLPTAELICGGFPCQPFSNAGNRRGAEDDRYLWPEMLRVVSELKPTWFIGENVAGIINMALDTVLSDLEGEGYTCETFVIPASAVNAQHRRDRVWIVGHSKGKLWHEYANGASQEVSRSPVRIWGEQPGGSGLQVDVPNADSQGVQGSENTGSVRESGTAPIEQPIRYDNVTGGFWNVEPGVGRVAHGVPDRVDRLKSLGNAVVPQVVEVIGRAIMSL